MISERIKWVDFAKGIGIILVVYGHVVRGLLSSNIINNKEIFNYIDNIIYTFHIPLFFFLSGFFFINSIKKGHLYFIKNRIKNILYPYIIWSLIQGLIMIIFSKYINSHRSFKELINIFFMPIDQFWFLYSLFFISIFSSLLYFNDILIKSKYYSVFLFIMFIIIFIFQEKIISVPFLWFIFHNIVYFYLGIVFSIFFSHTIFRNLNKKIIRLLFFLFFVIFVLYQYLFNFYLSLPYKTTLYYIIFPLTTISILTIVMFSIIFSNKFNFINYLGMISLEIYVMHIIAASGVRVILSKFLGINNIVLHLLFGIIGGLLIPILFLKLFNDKGKILFRFNNF